MDDQQEKSINQTEISHDAPEKMSMAEFLESIPPNETVDVEDLVTRGDYHISTPEIRLHCSHESCNGTRFFRYSATNVPLL
jgi:hypothetical protein